MLEVPGGSDQAAHLLATQHDRQGARHKHRLHLRHQLGHVQRDVEEELQSRDRRVERDRRGAVIDQVQLVAAQILDRGRIRRAAQNSSRNSHGAHVGACVWGASLRIRMSSIMR